LKTKIFNLLVELKISEIKGKFVYDPDVNSFGVTFEVSESRAPQRIGKVERKF
jgi:hypothetical protein